MLKSNINRLLFVSKKKHSRTNLYFVPCVVVLFNGNPVHVCVRCFDVFVLVLVVVGVFVKRVKKRSRCAYMF